MSKVPINIPRQNPHHPLPSDYPELTEEGKKEARLAVVCDRSSPEAAVTAWHCFRQWYLRPSPTFYKALRDSPPFHYQIPYDLNAYRMNVLAAPRGSAKTFVVGLEIPIMELCTQPNYDTTLCLATDRMIGERFDKIMQELEGNDYILNDFGKLRPPKGGGVWSRHYLRLRNGARLQGFSTEGKKRGARPDLFLLDDPEFDAASEASNAKLRENFEILLFKIILPMLEEGSRIFWIGTMISRRTFIYSAFHGEDPRFHYWNRRILAAARKENGEFVDLLWPDKWPASTLRRKEGEIGPTAFASEYLNSPISEQSRLLYVDQYRNRYSIQGTTHENPFEVPNETRMFHHVKANERGGYEPASESYTGWLKGLYRIITIDYAYTVGATSDFSCIAVTGVDRKDIMWLLDIWVGKLMGDQIHKLAMAMGVKWRVHLVAPEAVAIQERMLHEMRRCIEDSQGVTNWLPRVSPPQYPPNLDKGERIAAALEWRLGRGFYKIPSNYEECLELYPRPSHIGFRILEGQIADFTPDLNLLPKDDAIDAAAMVSYVPRQRGVKLPPEPTVQTVTQMLKDGERMWPDTGIPLMSGINSSEITPDVLDAMQKKRYNTDRSVQRFQPMTTGYDKKRRLRPG